MYHPRARPPDSITSVSWNSMDDNPSITSPSNEEVTTSRLASGMHTDSMTRKPSILESNDYTLYWYPVTLIIVLALVVLLCKKSTLQI